MRITVNPDTESSGFGYAEAGRYDLRVVKCEEATGQNFPYLKWEFELTDPDVPSVEGKGKPGHVFENTTLKPEAQFKLKQVIEAIGADWADFDTSEMAGMELSATLKLKEYQGVISNEVSKYIPKA